MVKRLLLGSLLAAAGGGPAVAQVQQADPAAPDDGSAPATTDAATTARWPAAVIDRPLTLPAGLLLAGADFVISNALKVTTTGTSSTVAEGLALSLGYGVTNDLEINTLTPTYAITLDPNGSAKGPLDVGAGYDLLRGAMGGKLEIVARAVVGLKFADSTTVRPLRLGVQVQYNATPKLAFLSHDIGAGNLGINIALDGDPKPVFLTVPVGVGYQAMPTLWIEADTALAPAIKIANGSNYFITDITPLFVTGIYNMMAGHLDILGYIGFGDLQHARDTWSFGAGFRYYVGKT